jgi:hypothetical protein
VEGKRHSRTEVAEIASLHDFGTLDKLLILEVGVRQTPSLDPGLREALLAQIVAIKDDLRVVSTLLTGDFPTRTRAAALPEWARPDVDVPQRTKR